MVTVAGVMSGAALHARLQGTFRWEGFSQTSDLMRHLAGGAFMGGRREYDAGPHCKACAPAAPRSPMNPQIIQELIETGLPGARAQVRGDLPDAEELRDRASSWDNLAAALVLLWTTILWALR